MFPLVRCTGCNKVLGEFWDEFKQDYKNVTDNDYSEIFKKYNIIRVCCRNSLLSTMELWTLHV